MKKKISIIIFIFILIQIFNLAYFAKGFYCYLFFFKTDKQIYYNNENIKINASWELDYNPGNEISYIQIHIYDIFNNLLWNSSKYEGISIFQENWTINIKNLNISFIDYSNLLYIKFYYYFFRISDMFTVSGFIDTIEIKTIKRNISCQLIGFTDHLKYGELLCFNARFYNKSLENNSNLINQIVLFKVISNDSILYKNNFTTNLFGMIKINISTFIHLKIGRNFLIFNITDKKFYKDSEFEYELIVEEFMELSNSEIENSLRLNVISFFSVLCILIGLFSLIFYNNYKNLKQRNLAEITIKY